MNHAYRSLWNYFRHIISKSNNLAMAFVIHLATLETTIGGMLFDMASTVLISRIAKIAP
jgi:hypothetical protein